MSGIRDIARNSVRTPLKAASVLASASALVLAAAIPAYAHYTRTFEGSDYVGVGADHRWVEVCDKEEDGNGVYALFWVKGSSTIQKVGDANGSSSGCGNKTFSSDVVSATICEDDAGDDTCRGSGVL